MVEPLYLELGGGPHGRPFFQEFYANRRRSSPSPPIYWVVVNPKCSS